MTNVAWNTLTKVGKIVSHGVTLGVIKGGKKGVKLKLIVSLHLVVRPSHALPGLLATQSRVRSCLIRVAGQSESVYELPGLLGCAHPIPQETTPIRVAFPLTTSTRGPPLSPWQPSIPPNVL